MAYLKRGQVTPFIIIGILLLIGAVMLFTAREQKTFAPQEAPTAVQDVPLELDALNVFITQCVEQKSAEAIVLLGQHGGYIDPASADYGVGPFVANPANPTESQALTFGEGWDIPYWHHMDKPNNGGQGYHFKSNTPRSEDVTGQISRYVEKHLPDCLGGFAEFVSQGYTIAPKAGLKAETILTTENIVVDLTYPLQITKGTSVLELKKFRAVHEVALGKLLEFAQHIVKKMTEAYSVESVIKYVISSHSGLNNDLPPLGESQIGGVRQTWSETEIKQKLETLLSYRISQLPVKGTAGYAAPELTDPRILSDPIQRGVAQYLNSLDISDPANKIDTRRYAVELEYIPSWPSYFDVVKGELIGPSSEFKPPVLSGFLAVLQLPDAFRSYNTPYDVSLPVMIQITDPKARMKDPFSPNKKGYSFFLAIEANIRDNNAVTGSYRPPSLHIGYETGFSPLCTEAQRNSAEVTIDIRDAATNQPVPNAAIAFGGCPITAGSSPLKSKFPVGGLDLEVSAKGYLSERLQFFTSLTQPKQKTVSLQPLKETRVRVQKYTYEKQAASIGTVRGMKTDPVELWELSTAPRNLLESEQTLVTFERVGDGPAYSSAVPVRGAGTQKIKLAPGRYKITTVTMLYEPIVIPECTDCCDGFASFSVAPRVSVTACLIPIEVPASRQEPFMEGTVETIADITPQMLSSNQPLTIFTLALNMRDVPVERQGINPPPAWMLPLLPSGILFSSVQTRERMITDLGMLTTMRADAQKPEIARLLKPR